MKKLTMIIAIMIFLFSFSTICNSAIIEMYFEDDNGGHQSLEFDSDISYNNRNLIEFGNVIGIYNEYELYELNPSDVRGSNALYSKYSRNFGFRVGSNLSEEYSESSIYSKSITRYLGYPYMDELTPILLEEMFDKMIDLPNFFEYKFYASELNNNDLQNSNGDTTLKSWNYKTSNVPIPGTIWLISSSLIGLISLKNYTINLRNKK